MSSSLSLLSLEREAELSRGEAIIAAQLQQPKLLESKGTGLLRLKVIFALSLLFFNTAPHRYIANIVKLCIG